jgi:hypothetical protein
MEHKKTEEILLLSNKDDKELLTATVHDTSNVFLGKMGDIKVTITVTGSVVETVGGTIRLDRRQASVLLKFLEVYV